VSLERTKRVAAPLPAALVLVGCAIATPGPFDKAPIGVTFRYEIHTHCGLNLVPIVLNGSEWRIQGDDGGANPPPGFGNPSDNGEVTLTSRDRGIYRSSGGVERVMVRGRDYVPPPSDYLVPCF
jgi:hypothetical protein